MKLRICLYRALLSCFLFVGLPLKADTGIEKTTFLEMEAIAFQAGGYEAILIPGMGASVVRLYHREKHINILRTPTAAEAETFRKRPQIFGTPLLFPPNRIADGTYTYHNRTYRLPITLAKQNCHHHGDLKSQPFAVTRLSKQRNEVLIEAEYRSDSCSDAIFRYFPHPFICRMTLRLSARGLTQTVTFINTGDEPMPVGMGYHTPLMVPFEPGTGDYRMWLSAGDEWVLNERFLPTGKTIPLNDTLSLLRTEGIAPLAFPYEKALANKPLIRNGKIYNGAIITNTETGNTLYYEVDKQFRHWTLWNNGAKGDYVCPEPQTWAINAPNLSVPAEISGFQAVGPGESWSATTHLYLEFR
ncbi:MAG: aldose 1-epimerase, partial [Bacteroidales bacterium]